MNELHGIGIHDKMQDTCIKKQMENSRTHCKMQQDVANAKWMNTMDRITLPILLNVVDEHKEKNKDLTLVLTMD